MASSIKEKKTRFNLVDFIIIAVVIACIIATVFRGAIIDKLKFSSNADTAKVYFYAENLTEQELAFITIGDELSLDGETFGVIKDYVSYSQTVVVPTTDKTGFTSATDGSLYTITGELEINGQNTDEGFFFASDTHVGVGKVLGLEGKNYNISIVITKIMEN